jgi:hypothetical protein
MLVAIVTPRRDVRKPIVEIGCQKSMFLFYSQPFESCFLCLVYKKISVKYFLFAVNLLENFRHKNVGFWVCIVILHMLD